MCYLHLTEALTPLPVSLNGSNRLFGPWLFQQPVGNISCRKNTDDQQCHVNLLNWSLFDPVSEPEATDHEREPQRHKATQCHYRSRSCCLDRFLSFANCCDSQLQRCLPKIDRDCSLNRDDTPKQRGCHPRYRPGSPEKAASCRRVRFQEGAFQASPQERTCLLTDPSRC